ncbi:hypothetical protein SDC9_88921 [bioreactor metagenome]|uniref:Uncharacterized protein n=1 Tax=bioreactor metagenome TaxID=1076179 RepID=A0A644ZNC7_9ZZZZ
MRKLNHFLRDSVCIDIRIHKGFAQSLSVICCHFLHAVVDIFVDCTVYVVAGQAQCVVGIGVIFVVQFNIGFQIVHRKLVCGCGLFHQNKDCFTFDSLIKVTVPVLLCGISRYEILSDVIRDCSIIFFLGDISLAEHPEKHSIFSVKGCSQIFFSFSVLGERGISIWILWDTHQKCRLSQRNIDSMDAKNTVRRFLYAGDVGTTAVSAEWRDVQVGCQNFIFRKEIFKP